MWTITELKTRGKAAFKANYWIAVLVALVLMIISAQGSGVSTNQNNYNENYGNSYSTYEDYSDAEEDWVPVEGDDTEDIGNLLGGGFAAALGGVSLLVVIAAILIDVFLLNPLCVGCRRFFLVNLYQKANLGEMGFAFHNGWKNTALVMFLKDLKLFLWTLLLIVPGLIKYYEYRMIPYLLAENPQMSSQEAFETSRQMMMGNKWNAFVLDLSFIGWDILSALTLNLVGIFYSNPYRYSTEAALYDCLQSTRGHIN